MPFVSEMENKDLKSASKLDDVFIEVILAETRGYYEGI